MKEAEDIRLIDAYINGTISDTDEWLFNQKLEQDPEFAKTYFERLEFVNQFVDVVSHKQVSKEIEEGIQKRRSRVRYLGSNIRYAVAACISTLVISATMLYLFPSISFRFHEDDLAKMQQPLVDSINQLEIENQELKGKYYGELHESLVSIFDLNAKDVESGMMMGDDLKVPAHVISPVDARLSYALVNKDGIRFEWKGDDSGEASLYLIDLLSGQQVFGHSVELTPGQYVCVDCPGIGKYAWYIQKGNQRTGYSCFYIVLP